MANNTTNRLRVEGSGADKVCEFIEYESEGEFYFDFERVIPIPEVAQETIPTNFERSENMALGLALLKPETYLDDVKNHRILRDQLGESYTMERLNFVARKLYPDAISHAQKCLACFEATGFYTEYAWQRGTWGTNEAYEYQRIEESQDVYECYFETRWTPAIPVIAELSRQFPELKFRYYYLDEGGGFENAVSYKAGVENADTEWFNFCHSIYGDED